MRHALDIVSPALITDSSTCASYSKSSNREREREREWRLGECLQIEDPAGVVVFVRDSMHSE